MRTEFVSTRTVQCVGILNEKSLRFLFSLKILFNNLVDFFLDIYLCCCSIFGGIFEQYVQPTHILTVILGWHNRHRFVFVAFVLFQMTQYFPQKYRNNILIIFIDRIGHIQQLSSPTSFRVATSDVDFVVKWVALVVYAYCISYSIYCRYKVCDAEYACKL